MRCPGACMRPEGRRQQQLSSMGMCQLSKMLIAVMGMIHLLSEICKQGFACNSPPAITAVAL